MNVPQIPLPSLEHMELVCGPRENLCEHFLERGQAIARRLGAQGLLGEGARFLDVGCGCGRVARWLLQDSTLCRYVGFDRHPGMIDWCQHNLGTRNNRFEFLFFDIESAYGPMDGHKGSVPAMRFRFPFDDNSFDSALLASVFTHMPLDESAHYLKELNRVLAPGGKLLLTVFLSRSGKERAEGHNFYYARSCFQAEAESIGFLLTDLGQLQTGGTQNWYLLSSTLPD